MAQATVSELERQKAQAAALEQYTAAEADV